MSTPPNGVFEDLEVNGAKEFLTNLNNCLAADGFVLLIPVNEYLVDSLKINPREAARNGASKQARFRMELTLCISRHIREMTEECFEIVSQYSNATK